MMGRRIAAIIFIFVCATVAWGILGASIFSRTYSLDSSLEDRVVSTWGAPHTQSPPIASYEKTVMKRVEVTENNRQVTRQQPETQTVSLPLESSRINVDLDLEHRQKGLLWYSTYKVNFGGLYIFRNTSEETNKISFSFNFPTSKAIYDDLVMTADGQTLALVNSNNAVTATGAQVAPGQIVTLKVGYRSQGLNEWRYNFGGDVSQVRDFTLDMTTNFKEIDFPANTLSPSEKEATARGWHLNWNYKNLVSGYQIGMTMPEKLQPGPLAGRISLFAPVSLFFFFFLMFIITTMRGIELHPMNYFFLAAAFFAFHLLLAYLVDHISIHLAFGISSLVSIFLVTSYLRLVVGTRFAMREAAFSQFVYLVMFSYAFFFKGFTGLAITIGSILTLFVVMQVTGRMRWADKFAAPKTSKASTAAEAVK
ncbi:MAG TPA: inner membrane CreD family protein [Pyrinomonadaceae bacterium]|jgi:inner membrane protein involved in colicin E2 resistance|nr:inner membrane CreD family protein [Pyrinomonadaceae bacterium]